MRLAAAALALYAAAAPAQTGTIAGRVTDAAGLPLPGASVVAQGTTSGAAAGADGRFAFSAPAGAAVVEASYLGHLPARAAVDVGAGATVEVHFALEEAVVGAGEVVVSASRAPTATRTDAPVRLVPASIAVVPVRLLESGPRDLAGALRSVPGVALAGREHPYAALTIRGFAAENTSTYRRNGVEFAHYYEPLQANVERIEVLRGPASVLFGRIEPGGVVNLVTERPQPRRRAEVLAEVDEWGAHRYAADITGPLVGDGSLLARVNSSAARIDAWRAGGEARETFVAPALTWQPRPAVRVTVEAEALTARAAGDPGVALPDTAGAAPFTIDDIPGATRFFGEPGATYSFESRFGMTTIEAQHAGWSLRAVASTGRYAYERGVVQLVGMQGPGQVARQYRLESSDYRYVQGEAALSGSLRTGPVTHGVGVGIEAVRLAIGVGNRASLVPLGDSLVFATIAPVDLHAPAPAGLPRASDLVEYVFADGSGVNAGVFAQDRITLRAGRGLIHAIPSARLSYVTAGAEWFALVRTDESPAGLNDRRVSLTALTPGFAMLYEPARWVSTYASWGRSFNPVFQQVSPSGEPFDPTLGEGFEAGAKGETRRLRATLALFTLEKRGALSQRGDGSYVQTGAQRSRGLEADLLAEPLVGVTVAAAYAFTDAVVTADEQVPVGSRLPGAPRHAGSVWVEASLPGPLSGIAFHAGVRAAGARYASLWNTVRLPAHAVVDVGASFARGRLRAGVSLENALDSSHAAGADRHPDAGPGPALVVAWPAPARTVRVRVAMAL